jgi:acyl-CoA synthetase (AMP-forming)/AMP-acid ligase II
VNLLLLLDMAASANPDAVAVTAGDDSLSYAELLAGAWGARGPIGDAAAVAYVGTNRAAFPLALYGSAAAEVPFIPLNYRLGSEQLAELLARHENLLVVAEEQEIEPLAGLGHRVVLDDDFAAAALGSPGSGEVPADGEATALLLHTSGTTAAPKAAVLRHRHLTSYILGSVEFASAEPTDAVLVSVPPYHVAGVANLLSNTYMNRRIVYLQQFDADSWIDTVRRESITNAMVVPTMLARICDALAHHPGPGLPSLRALSYGGARTPVSVLEQAVALLPGVELTNAYGLTETSSTIAVLGPEDHRAAFGGDDPAARARLASAGQVLPTVEVEVRDELGAALPPGEPGEVWVRGEQVSGEYVGLGSGVDEDGWFPTRDRGWVDEDGYLFIEGRADDTIIRGGENIAPAEVEEVLLRHPDVHRCAVVGLPDEEWGQIIAAVVVLREGATFDPEDIRAFARSRLRGSKTPDRVTRVDELPETETGKLLRRVVLADLTEGS